MDQHHHPFLLRCLDLARIPGAAVEPNPRVGAVVVHQGRIVGEGWHKQFGGPHAEVNAVRSVANQHILKESTLYVSLEPCNHHGKTPPCTGLILEHQIPTVVIGAVDPNPKMAGKSLDFLRAQGVEVILNDQPDLFESLNKHFQVNQSQNRPFITLKWAQSADGYIAAYDHQGHPVRTRISTEITSRWVHWLRHEHHAILIGANTAITDLPRLDTRHFPGHCPIPIVLDRDNLLTGNMPFFEGRPRGIWVQGKPGAGKDGIESMQAENDLSAIMENLYQDKRIGSILVEGGRDVLQQFLNAGMADEVWVVEAPISLRKGVHAPILTADWILSDSFRSGKDKVNRFAKPFD